MQREPQSHHYHKSSFCNIVPAEQCQPGQKGRNHAVAQVHPIGPSRASSGECKPPTGTPKEGDYRGSVDHLSKCHFGVKGLCCSHEERSSQERDEPRETQVESWFRSTADGFQTEAIAVGSVCTALRISMVETRGEPAHAPGIEQASSGSSIRWCKRVNLRLSSYCGPLGSPNLLKTSPSWHLETHTYGRKK